MKRQIITSTPAVREFWQKFYDLIGIPPTPREIAAHYGLCLGTAKWYSSILSREAGIVTRPPAMFPRVKEYWLAAAQETPPRILNARQIAEVFDVRYSTSHWYVGQLKKKYPAPHIIGGGGMITEGYSEKNNPECHNPPTGNRKIGRKIIMEKIITDTIEHSCFRPKSTVQDMLVSHGIIVDHMLTMAEVTEFSADNSFICRESYSVVKLRLKIKAEFLGEKKMVSLPIIGMFINQDLDVCGAACTIRVKRD